jgi:hypothetical protein
MKIVSRSVQKKLDANAVPKIEMLPICLFVCCKKFYNKKAINYDGF